VFTVSKDCVDNLLTGFGYFTVHSIDCRSYFAMSAATVAPALHGAGVSRQILCLWWRPAGYIRTFLRWPRMARRWPGWQGDGQQLADREIRVGRSASCHSSDKRQAGNARRPNSSASDTQVT